MKCPPRKPPGPKNSWVELSLELKVYVEMLQGYNEKDGMVITSTVRTVSSVQKIIWLLTCSNMWLTGIVLWDWVDQNLMLLGRSEVFSTTGFYYYSFLWKFSCLNIFLKKGLQRYGIRQSLSSSSVAPADSHTRRYSVMWCLWRGSSGMKPAIWEALEDRPVVKYTSSGEALQVWNLLYERS
jgi:hypothetical protein